MIRSFKHKGLETLFLDGSTKGVQAKHAQKLTDILDLLDNARRPEDMGFPGSALHPLKGNRAGFWAVKVSGNWRLIFRMEQGDAHDVDYLDYH
ncbi:type II toxin-antitoxin system RelE/ParE family toxin [Fundidesulfovibrio butyratiphilus]